MGGERFCLNCHYHGFFDGPCPQCQNRNTVDYRPKKIKRKSERLRAMRLAQEQIEK